MLKFSAIVAFVVLIAVGSFVTAPGQAAYAALGQAVLAQGYAVTGTGPTDSVANR